jgi:hypothetical protein
MGNKQNKVEIKPFFSHTKDKEGYLDFKGICDTIV